MWQLVKLDVENGEWFELSSYETLAESSEALAKETSNTFIFPKIEPPDDPPEQDKIIKDIMEVNNGNILRVMVGVSVLTLDKLTQKPLCSGNCYCVSADGMRRCETYYCNYYWCWWVPCGMGC